MKTTSQTLLMGTILCLAVLSSPKMALAQINPHPSLEYADGPSSKIDVGALQSIKTYAKDANMDILRLLKSVSQSTDSVEVKNALMSKMEQIIRSSQDSRSVLLLTHSLQAGMTLVRLIDQQSIQRGLFYTPEGTVDQQVRILKQSLNFAKDYYESDYSFINGVLEKNEIKSNPKFVEFGVRLNQFIIRMSDGVLSARASYGMIRWSLGVLANYIKNDKEIGIAYSSTRYNLATVLLEKGWDGQPVYPDLVNGEAAPSDVECLNKIKSLKLLAKNSMNEISSVVIKNKN